MFIGILTSFSTALEVKMVTIATCFVLFFVPLEADFSQQMKELVYYMYDNCPSYLLFINRECSPNL